MNERTENVRGRKMEASVRRRGSEGFYDYLAAGAARFQLLSAALTEPHLEADGWDPLTSTSLSPSLLKSFLPLFLARVMDDHRVKQYTASTESESWYDALQAFTFATRTIPLSVEEAQAILETQDVTHPRFPVESRLLHRVLFRPSRNTKGVAQPQRVSSRH